MQLFLHFNYNIKGMRRHRHEQPQNPENPPAAPVGEEAVPLVTLHIVSFTPVPGANGPPHRPPKKMTNTSLEYIVAHRFTNVKALSMIPLKINPAVNTCQTGQKAL